MEIKLVTFKNKSEKIKELWFKRFLLLLKFLYCDISLFFISAIKQHENNIAVAPSLVSDN